MATPPVPNSSFEVAETNLKTLDSFVNLTEGSAVNREGVLLTPLPVMQQTFNSLGYIDKGTFAAGATLSSSNEILSDGTNYWRWSGVFPKTVTAGSSPTPSGVGAWLNIGDSTKWAELAAVGSTVPVAGVQAKDLALSKWHFINPRDIDTSGVVDAAAIINAALAVSDFVALPAGDIKITSNINIAGKVLIGKGKNKTRLICTSPTSNGRFGGSENSQAAVYSRGTNGSPVQGAFVGDLTIVCNGLLNATGAVGLKGVMFYKSHGCKAERVRVIESRSYAFWCADADVGTDYASAVFEDCDETGSEIGFEAVNVSNCQFIRCTSLKPSASSAWPVFSMFHSYALKDDALVIFDNCYGKGYSSTVVDLVLKCRNIQFKGGYFEQLNSSNSAIFLTNTASDYLSVEFGGAVFKSAGYGGVLSSGALADSGQKAVKFIGGSIKAMAGIGFDLQSSDAVYEFVGTDVESNNGTSAGLCFFASVAGNTVQFTGGSLKAVGGAGTAVSQNVNMRVSPQTIQTPSTAQVPQIKQQVYGETTLIYDGGNSFFNALFPSAADMSKVQVSAFVNATGAADGSEAAAQAAVISFAPLDNQVVRFYAATAASGRNVRWQMTEYV